LRNRIPRPSEAPSDAWVRSTTYRFHLCAAGLILRTVIYVRSSHLARGANDSRAGVSAPIRFRSLLRGRLPRDRHPLSANRSPHHPPGANNQAAGTGEALLGATPTADSASPNCKGRLPSRRPGIPYPSKPAIPHPFKLWTDEEFLRTDGCRRGALWQIHKILERSHQGRGPCARI